MLKSWRIRNFKSFYDVDEIKLAPLTLLCGANSSGKSSIIQSMLLIKQTLEHSPTERVIALNGPLVQLGTFSDILNDHAATNSANQIGLGWEIDHNADDEFNGNIYLGEYHVEHSCHSFIFDTFGPASEKSTLDLQPDLKSARTSARLTDNNNAEHELNIEIARATGRRISYDSSTLGDETGPRYRVVKIDKESADAAGPSHVQSTVVGANVQHFAPNALIVRYDRNRRTAKQIAISLTDLSSGRRFRLPPTRVSDAVRTILENSLSHLKDQPRVGEQVAQLLNFDRKDQTVDELSRRIRESPLNLRRLLREILPRVEKDIEQATYAELGRDRTISVARVDPIARVTYLNDRYFRFRMRYIGPLRTDPRPLYPLQALSSPTDVGPKGEQTAAVLHLNSKRKVKTIQSTTFRNAPASAAADSEMTLTEAVGDWLKYLGVADDFETAEKGKLGHELRVRTPGTSKFQDLTNVGVGVSQVLPIVVTCLLAPPGSTIIIEQPELHLHPAVQARLADFFVAMILLKKQCIIETHSEHLIERIRFRVAQDRTDTVHQNTKIYFFHKAEGNTSVKEVSVTRYGAIDDWPKDFFDQSQIANEQIVMMALQRRRDETRKGSD